MDVNWIKARFLGSGSYGIVSLAAKYDNSDTSFSDIAAVKSAPFSFSTTLKKEGKVLHQLRGCPQIIQCFGEDISIENHREVYNLLLEYAPCGTLLDLIKLYLFSSTGNMPEYLVSRYCYMLLKGLSHTHRQGFVHCDLKPENILVFPSHDGIVKELKIADFGLAKRSSDKDRLVPGPPNFNRGTLLYSSPESVSWGIHKPATDIWSLGCIMVEMMTGKTMWNAAKSSQDLIDEIVFIGPKTPENISAGAEHFLQKCLEKNEEKRWTADMLLNHPFIVMHNFGSSFDINGLTGNNPFGPGTSWVSTFGLFSGATVPAKIEEAPIVHSVHEKKYHELVC